MDMISPRGSRPLTLGSMRQLLPGVMHHPDALPQGNARRRPARDCCPVGRLRHLKILNPGDVLEDAVARGVPYVDAEGKVRFGLHGRIRLDSPAPRAIYTPCCCVA
jgi:hypothetical protein